MPVDIDAIYAGLSHAETGSEKNPHIRTKVRKAPGGSSAFGPVQITGSLAEGARKNGYLKQTKEFYDKEMKPRYDAMNKHGNNKGKIKDYDPDYDYGGTAKFDPSKHGQDYEMFAKETIEGVAKEAGNDENKFIEKWRGKKEKDDPVYYKKVREGKKKYLDEHNYDPDLAKEFVRQLTR